jgi:hypothetical protein
MSYPTDYTYCGTKTYTYSHSWFTHSAISPSGTVDFIVNSNNVANVGSHTVTVTVSMTSWSTYVPNKTQVFSVILKHPCLVATITQQSTWPDATI